MTQSPLAIIILFSFGEWESGSALGTSDFQIRHSCLPEKFAVSFLSSLSDESLPHARFAVQGEEKDVSTGSGDCDWSASVLACNHSSRQRGHRDGCAPVLPFHRTAPGTDPITELGSLQLSHMRSHRFTQ